MAESQLQEVRPADRAAALGSPVARPQGLAAALGSPVAAPPNGRVLGFDLTNLDENSLLGANHEPRLYALGSGPSDFHPERPPLVFVHGVNGDPRDLQDAVNRFRDSGYQCYVLAYDDMGRQTSENGHGFARELDALRERLGNGRDMTIVAHSMGGLVSRQALNDLSSGDQPTISQFGRMRLVAVDSPWHGYGGPEDGAFLDMARPFIPDGYEDMRAPSAMFRGSGGSRPDGLLTTALPDNVDVELVFAREANVAHDLSHDDLDELPGELVAYFTREDPVRGNDQMMNYWNALIWTEQFPAFRDEMEAMADRGELTESTARACLDRHYPRFSGDHTGILRESSAGAHRPGEPVFLDWLSRRLGDGRP